MVGDVWQNNVPVTNLLFYKSIVKWKEINRAVPVNYDDREAIEAMISWHKQKFGRVHPKRVLFISRQGNGAMNRKSAHRVLKGAFEAAGLNGKLATHSLRKSFAQRLYEQIGDIYVVQELLGTPIIDCK